MTTRCLSRRAFLPAAATAPFLDPYHRLAAAERKHYQIRDVRTMTLQGPSRTYLLVKVMADDGLYGVSEAYGKSALTARSQSIP